VRGFASGVGVIRSAAGTSTIVHTTERLWDSFGAVWDALMRHLPVGLKGDPSRPDPSPMVKTFRALWMTGTMSDNVDDER